MKFRYTRIQTYESDVKPEQYLTTDPHTMLLLDLDILREDTDLCFDNRPNQKTTYKIENIVDGKPIDTVVFNDG